MQGKDKSIAEENDIKQYKQQNTLDIVVKRSCYEILYVMSKCFENQTKQDRWNGIKNMDFDECSKMSYYNEGCENFQERGLNKFDYDNLRTIQEMKEAEKINYNLFYDNFKNMYSIVDDEKREKYNADVDRLSAEFKSRNGK